MNLNHTSRSSVDFDDIEYDEIDDDNDDDDDDAKEAVESMWRRFGAGEKPGNFSNLNTRPALDMKI